MTKTLLAVALILALAVTAHAKDKSKPDDDVHPIDAALGKCIDKDPSTAGMMGCLATAETAWDSALNQTYGALTAKLKGPALESLKVTQRAWVVHRDAEIRLQESLVDQLDGTMWRAIMADQRVELIKSRVEQLKSYEQFLDNGKK
jgi:uncharacterized protein YecT (DUF1311 family)